MESTTLTIPNISCHHCVMTVKQALGKLEGVSNVDGDPGTKKVVIQWESPATLEGIRAALRHIDYPARE
jgi:copper chaperone